jgi:hypothetical protein
VTKVDIRKSNIKHLWTEGVADYKIGTYTKAVIRIYIYTRVCMYVAEWTLFHEICCCPNYLYLPLIYNLNILLYIYMCVCVAEWTLFSYIYFHSATHTHIYI